MRQSMSWKEQCEYKVATKCRTHSSAPGPTTFSLEIVLISKKNLFESCSSLLLRYVD